MVEIGGKPILWHIMNIYAANGVEEFVVALGYKGEVVKEYFLNYPAMLNDFTDAIGLVEADIDADTIRVRIVDGKLSFWEFTEHGFVNFPFLDYLESIGADTAAYEGCQSGPLSAECAAIQLANIDGWAEWWLADQ